MGFAIGVLAAAVPFVLTVSGLRRQLDVAEQDMDYNADLLEQCRQRLECDSIYVGPAFGDTTEAFPVHP